MRIKLLFALIVVGLMVGGYRAGTVALKDELQLRLNATLGRPVAVKSVGLVFPPGFEIRGLTLEDRTVTPAVVLELDRLLIDWQWSSKGFTYQGEGELKTEGGESLARLQILEGAQLLIDPTDLKNWQPYLATLLGVPPPMGTFKAAGHLTLSGGMLTMETQVTAADVVFPTEEPTVLGPTGNQIARLLRDPAGKVGFKFVVQGPLAADFDWSEQFSASLRQALSQAVTQSIQQTLSEAEQVQLMEEMIRSSLESR